MKKTVSSEFSRCFNGAVILDCDVEAKLIDKHKVYKDDLIDALGDPYAVVMKTKQKSPTPEDKPKSTGKVYEILCETEAGRVLFVVSRLFPDGNLYIITAYWAEDTLEQIYRQESEVLRDE